MFIKFEKLIELLKSLISSLFYGRIIISFEAGKITHIKKEETIKAADLS